MSIVDWLQWVAILVLLFLKRPRKIYSEIPYELIAPGVRKIVHDYLEGEK